MKLKLLFYFLFFVSVCSVKGRSFETVYVDMKVDTLQLSLIDKKKYEIAFQHICTDSFPNEMIFISNILWKGATGYVFFENELKEKHLWKDEMYSYEDTNSTYVDFSTFLPTKNKVCTKYIVTFSRLYESMDLFAEVIENIYEGTPMGETTSYFFHFKPNGILDFVYKIITYGL